MSMKLLYPVRIQILYKQYGVIYYRDVREWSPRHRSLHRRECLIKTIPNRTTGSPYPVNGQFVVPYLYGISTITFQTMNKGHPSFFKEHRYSAAANP